jgi:hypothetical protein
VALHAGHLLFVASIAIFLHHNKPRFPDKYDLRFIPEGENRCMPETIFRLEKIFIEDVIVRNMAIVAIGHPPVGTMAPGGELRRHDVAVHAG